MTTARERAEDWLRDNLCMDKREDGSVDTEDIDSLEKAIQKAIDAAHPTQAKIAALLEAANEFGHERTYSGIYVDDELRRLAADLAGDGGEKGTDDA